MAVSPLINVYLDPEVKKTGLGQETLKPGDALRLRVIEILSDHRVVADFGKFRAKAEVTFAVQRGEELMVKVVEAGQQLRLSVIQPALTSADATNMFPEQFKVLSDELFEQIRSVIQQAYNQNRDPGTTNNLPQSIANALGLTQHHFAAVTLGDSISTLALDLKAFIEDSGIFFEKKIETILKTLVESSQRLSLENLMHSPEIKEVFLKDVKPNLLLLKDFFDTRVASPPNADAKNMAKLKTAINSLLSEIDNQQNIAVKKHLHPEPFQVLTFLLPLKENDQKAKVKFYYPKKQKSGAKNGFKVSILLNMDAMGEIRSDLYHLNNELTITFFVKDDGTKKTIESHYSEIRTALDHAFEYLVLRTVISSKKINDFHQEDWLPSEDKRVDVRI
jgi:hypothetical protein